MREDPEIEKAESEDDSKPQVRSIISLMVYGKRIDYEYIRGQGMLPRHELRLELKHGGS
jgi:hypothetical protein